MEPQLELSRLSTPEVRSQLKQWEKRRDSLRAAFPYLEDDSASLTAQYMGGSVWDEFASANSQIAKLKLELIGRDQAPDSLDHQRGPLKDAARNTPGRTPKLTRREGKMWEVIQRGSKGPTYCRELESAGVKPRRTGSWKDCPGTYSAGYKDGYWRQRIQDEKSKIRRKAELAKLAGE